MAKREMVVEYVDSLLKRLTGKTDLIRDSDGDWPFGLNDSVMFVRVSAGDDPTVRVWGVASKSVPPGEKLFTLLNEINQKLEFCRAFCSNGTVFVATELVGETLDIEELDTAIRRVATSTESLGSKVVATCGGSLVRPPETTSAGAESETETASTEKKPTGGYL